MRMLIISIFFSVTSYSQSILDVGKVKGEDIKKCVDSVDGNICHSKLLVDIWLTRSAMRIDTYQTINLSFDGYYWKAVYFDGNSIKNKVDTFTLRPVYSFDSIFVSLKNNRIFLLPDQNELGLEGNIEDGYDYMLTYKAGNKFRTYEFSSPDIYREYNDNIRELEYYMNITNILFNWLAKEEPPTTNSAYSD